MEQIKKKKDFSYESDNLKSLLEESISIILKQIQRTNLKSNLTSFQKTERLLYNYNNFLEVIKDKEKQIDDIKKEGVPKKSKSIAYFNANQSYINVSEQDKIDEMIKTLEKSIESTQVYIKIIDNGLDKIRNDKYFRIIELKYFKNLSGEDIAEQLRIDVSTVSRNKNRLINKLKIILFSDESIRELFQ